MRVALYQCPPLPLEPAANLHRLHRVAMEANGSDLLVLPEMFMTGYNIGAEAVSTLAEVYNGEWAQQIGRIAKAAGLAIVYGYPERTADGQIYNAVQLIDSTGERLANYRKSHLFGDLDRSMFSPGEADLPVVELNGWKLGFLICYDLEFPENARRLALAGAELIVAADSQHDPVRFRCRCHRAVTRLRKPMLCGLRQLLRSRRRRSVLRTKQHCSTGRQPHCLGRSRRSADRRRAGSSVDERLEGRQSLPQRSPPRTLRRAEPALIR